MLHRRAPDQSRIDAYETRRRTAIDTINRENPLEIIETPTNTPTAQAALTGQALAIIAATVIALGAKRVKPSVYLSPTAHTISSSPAITR